MKKFDKEKVKEYLKLFNENYSKEFHVALLIFDRLDISTKDITEEIVNRVGNISYGYDSIYNEDLNYELYELEEEINEKVS